MTSEKHNKNTKLTPTRRNALKLVAGTATSVTFGATPATAQKQDRQQWAFETGNWVVSSPTVVDSTVFVGSGRSLYAIDAETGDKQWTFETDGSVDSAPHVADDTVFIGSGTEDGNLYAIDTETGNRQWTFETDDYCSSPTVVDETIYFGGNNNSIYAVDADSGDQRWVFETGGTITPPAVVNGTAFAGSHDGNLYAIDAETGTEQWTRTIGSFVYSPPTVVDNTVFSNGYENFYAINAETGELRWEFEVRPMSAPTVANGTVFFGSWDANFYAIDAETGTEQWKAYLYGYAQSSPTVVDSTVFVGSHAGNLYALDAKTGTEQWNFETGNRVVSPPTVVDGTVFVGSNDEKIYAIDADVDSSSEDSRVRLKTLGHHDIKPTDDDDDEQSLFNLTVNGPSEAVAGSNVTISVDAQAVDSQLSAFQIEPNEQADHINGFDDLSVTTTADTQVADPGFVVYSEIQERVTVEWTGSIPETAEAGETFTLAGDALDESQNRQLLSHTVTVTNNPLEKYRNENDEVDDTGILEAIADWRDGDLEDTQLLELIAEWRDAGGNVEALPTGSLPNVK